jgi:hypothetical protein
LIINFFKSYYTKWYTMLRRIWWGKRKR